MGDLLDFASTSKYSIKKYATNVIKMSSTAFYILSRSWFFYGQFITLQIKFFFAPWIFNSFCLKTNLIESRK